MTELGANRYGKQSIRLVRVVRGPVHRVRDLTVDVSLEGGFGAAFTDGDNSSVVATDTMKNTVYALASEHLTGPIEAFGMALARHFLRAVPVERATITIREHAWEPLETGAGPAPDAFRRTGGATRTAVVTADAGGITVDSGIEDLVIMKTARSAFSGFPRDQYTTLAEVRTASWPPGPPCPGGPTPRQTPRWTGTPGTRPWSARCSGRSPIITASRCSTRSG